MTSTFNQIALAIAGLAIIGLGLFPGKGLKGGIIALAACVVAALIIHFVAN